MKPDLDLIIEFYEEEKLSLAQGIKEALAERDYEQVYQRGEALNRVEGKLYRMNALKDPLYGKRQQLERLIEGPLIDGMDEQLRQYFLTAMKGRIADKKERLERLKTQMPPGLIDSQDIDDALFDLYEGRHKGFKFSFPHRGSSLSLSFEISPKRVLFINVNIKDITSEYDPDDPEEMQVHLFENLGFRPDDSGKLLVYEYDMANFKSAWEIKTLLSRIIYDIGYFGEEKNGSLEFYD